MSKRVDESRHLCQTPTVVWNQSPMLLLKRTALIALSLRFFDDSDKVSVRVRGCKYYQQKLWNILYISNTFHAQKEEPVENRKLQALKHAEKQQLKRLYL